MNESNGSPLSPNTLAFVDEKKASLETQLNKAKKYKRIRNSVGGAGLVGTGLAVYADKVEHVDFTRPVDVAISTALGVSAIAAKFMDSRSHSAKHNAAMDAQAARRMYTQDSLTPPEWTEIKEHGEK